MKRMRLLTLCAAAAALLITSATAFAASSATKATIPFAFEVNGRVLQPGTYLFESADTSGVMKITSAAGDTTMTLIRNVNGVNPSRSTVEFAKSTGAPRLDRVVLRSNNGYRLLTLR